MVLGLEQMQKYIGVFDLTIIGIFILMLLFGALIGFFRIALKVANTLCGFIFSVVFASKFANVLGWFFRKPLYNHYYKKIAASKALSETTSDNPQEALAEVLHNYGLPKMFAKYIANRYPADGASDVKESICNSFANGITKVILTIMAFFVLWIGLSIIFFIFKKLIEKFRENHSFKVFDGILGAILGLILAFVIVEIMMFTIDKVASGSFAEFVARDLRIEKSNGFPLARWFVEKNLISAFIDMFF